MRSFSFLALFLFVSSAFAQYDPSSAFQLNFSDMTRLPEGTSGMGYTTDGKFVYAANGAPFHLDEVMRYDPFTAEWEVLAEGLGGAWKPNMVYFAPTKELILLNGMDKYQKGKEADRIRREVYAISVETGKVRIVGMNPLPRYGAGAAVWNGKVFVFGGRHLWNRSTPDAWTASVSALDPVSGEWERLPNMPLAKETAGEIVDGILYVFGGHNGGTVTNTINALSLESGEWYQTGELPLALSEHSVCRVGDKVLVVGDREDQQTLLSFDPIRGDVSPVASNWAGARNPGAVACNGRLYLFGGSHESPCDRIAEGQVAPLEGQFGTEAEAVLSFQFDLQPESGLLGLEWSAGGQVEYRLATLNGKVVQTKVLRKGQSSAMVKMPELKEGIYVVSMRSGKNEVSKRMLVPAP